MKRRPNPMGRQGLKPCIPLRLDVAAEQVAEKFQKCHFRGRGLPEESAFFLGLAKKQIPRFARDDIKLLFSAASEAATYKTHL
jgi:hypothetical protein